MHPQHINLDVLHIIMLLLDDRELVQLSTTCKLYRGPALKRILPSVWIHTPRQLTSFLACVLPEASIRATWIKTLYLEMDALWWNDEDEVADVHSVSMIASILENCQRLTALRIPSLGKLLTAEPQLGASIASLPALTYLDLYRLDDSPLIAQVLRDMKSQLHTLHVNYESDFDWGEFPLHDPESVRSTANLEVLFLHNIIFPPPDMQNCSWSSIRRLHSIGCKLDIGKLPSILPSLRDCGFLWSTELLRDRREALPLWQDLDLLEIELPLAACKLRWNKCSIHTLRLNGMSQVSDHSDDAVDLVRESRPLILSLRGLTFRNGPRFLPRLSSALASLRCLELTFMFSDNYSTLRYLLDILANCPLVYLKIGVSNDDEFGSRAVTVLDNNIMFRPSTFEDFALSIPALHYLSLSLSKPSQSLAEYDWWQIIRSKETGVRPEFKQLTQQNGQEVEERLCNMDRESLLHFNIDLFAA